VRPMARVDEALADSDAAIALARRVRNPTVLAIAAQARGGALQFIDAEASRAAFEESIEICESGAIQGGLDAALARVAALRMQAGDTTGALTALRTSLAHCREIGERLSVTTGLDSFVVVLTELGEMEAPVVAFAVIQTESFGPLEAVTGREQERREQYLAIARAALSDAAYEAALARGGSMSDEEALDFVLGELDRLLAQQPRD
jgi:hypothetical protein